MIKVCTCPACHGAFSLSLTPEFVRKAAKVAAPVFCPYCAQVLRFGRPRQQTEPWVRRVLERCEKLGKAMVK